MRDTAKNTPTQFLTAEQVHELNEKHGWFNYGDAQSGVSKAFAQDAIAMHERMRAAAPQMLAALKRVTLAIDNLGHAEGGLSGLGELNAAGVEVDVAIKAAGAA